MTSPTNSAARSTDGPQRLLFGRRQGPRLRPARRALLETELPRLRIDLPDHGRGADPGRLFDGVRQLWLEIGFGGGEHLAAQARAHPEVGFLGVEPFLNGVARLLSLLDADRSENVRILVDDARLLLAALPDATIDRAFVLFPDPWPKLRHHKRRIVNAETVSELARVTRPGGQVRLASDDRGYVRWMLDAMLREPRFAWRAERARNWRERPPDAPPSRYEEKARSAGRRCTFLDFTRVG